MAIQPTTTFRVCRKCGVSKPETVDYFQSYKSKTGQFLRQTCRVCRGGYEGEGRPMTRPRMLSDEERHERNRQRHLDNYRRNRDQRLAQMRARRAANPEKAKAEDRANYLKNKAGTDYHKRRYQRLDKAAARVALKEWKEAHPEKVKAIWKRTYEKNKEKHKARGLRWLQNNPEKAAAKRDRRRAKKVEAGGVYTSSDVAALIKVYGRVCFYCSANLAKFHIDHFIPLSKGGTNWPENLRLSCPTCNYSKGSKMPWEWKPERFQPL